MSANAPSRGRLGALALGALGVVYGDIGTSPLYAVRESLHPGHGVGPTPETILGVISLIFWSLVLLICGKYLSLMLRADRHGEGGIMALAALVEGTDAGSKAWFPVVGMLGLFGTALLYGDGMITPAISVLSAVEGLELIPGMEASQGFILPITVAILVGLFSVQAWGTARVGSIFGPVMLTWFGTLAALGLYQMSFGAEILRALNPVYSLQFLLNNGAGAFHVLGSVFLVVTGGEALYADMGHFGRKPIQLAWFTVAFPALMLNYLGQGALLLRDPGALKNPFFLMPPAGTLTFVVALATLATVIASQALISGVFSLTLQAVQLGYVPRLEVKHTSPTEKGQIYIPTVNWMLMLACIALVLGFGSSSNLAGAYGLAVTATMTITTILFAMLAYHGWRWRGTLVLALCGFFLAIEAVFLAANVVKIPQGGWFPILVGWAVFQLMTTWKEGRAELYRLLTLRTVPLRELLAFLEAAAAPGAASAGCAAALVSQQDKPHLPAWWSDLRRLGRVPGTAIFMYGNPAGTPPALLANLRHNRTLHDNVYIVGVQTVDQPYVNGARRIHTEPIQEGFTRVTLRFGYMEEPDVPGWLSRVVPLDKATFYLGRETVIPRRDQEQSELSFWRERLFAYMQRNAVDATSFFKIPPDKVVELGTQLEI